MYVSLDATNSMHELETYSTGFGGNLQQEVHRATKADAAPPPEEVGASLFFARCPPSLPYDELLQLFSAFGEVEKLNLYRRWAKARNSKGCGTVVFASKASAAAAKSALDGKHTFPDAESNMVVEWAEPSKLSRSDDSQTVSKPAAAKPKVQASSSNQSQQSKPLLEPILKCDSASHVLSGTWASGLACDGYSSGSDQDSHSPVHAHLVPMLPCTLDTVSPVTQSSDRSIPQSNSTAKDSSVNSLLAGLAAASGTSQANHDAAGLTYCGAQHLPGFPSMWGPSSSCDTLTAQQAAAIANSVAPAATAPAAAASFLGAAAGLVLLSDGDEPWQQQPCNAAGPSALQFSLTRARTSLTGAACQHALGASYCSPVFTPAPVYGIDESLASLLHSPEFAINSSSLSGDFMAAADLSSTLPQGSSGLPSLLEVIPAMSWLQLQQKEQQQQQKAMRDAAFASATRTSSGLFRTVPGQYNGLTDRCTAGGVATAAAAGVGLTGVSVALGHEEMRFDLSASAMRHIAPSLDAVSRISGARVMIEAAPRALQLRLQGGAVQLQNACQLLRMVLAN